MPPGPHPQLTAEDFLRTILRSGLMTRESLQDVLRPLGKEQRESVPFLARHITELGRLSSFQVQKLLKGVTLGLVLGPYHVVSPIGKGGMGTVYLASDTRNGQKVALKILPPKKAREEARMLARFQREMDISQRVAHPNVARTYETGEYRGVYYIAMEYIPGQTLHHLVARQGPLAVQQAARLAGEVAAGLAHAHDQGVIHRDLKPANIMVTPKGHAKVLDLGLALIEGEVVEDRAVVGGRGYIVGSMDYIAPEQTLDAIKVDGRADVYGLGCSVFFALTGRPPFPGGTSKEKIQRHRKEQPPALRELNPAVPEDFAAIVARMMAKKVDERYPSARAVQAALHKWAAGEPELPIDQPGDSSFELAVAELEKQEVASELVNEPILQVSEGEADVDNDGGGGLPAWTVREQNRLYIALLAGFVSFWVVLILLLGFLAVWLQ